MIENLDGRYCDGTHCKQPRFRRTLYPIIEIGYQRLKQAGVSDFSVLDALRHVGTICFILDTSRNSQYNIKSTLGDSEETVSLVVPQWRCYPQSMPTVAHPSELEPIVLDGPIFITKSISDEAFALSEIHDQAILQEFQNLAEPFLFLAQTNLSVAHLSSGERAIAMIVLLMAASRALNRPISVVLNGPQHVISPSNRQVLSDISRDRSVDISIISVDDFKKSEIWI